MIRTRPNQQQTTSGLSPSVRRLVSEMTRIGFGRIDAVSVVKGEPVLHAGARVVREHKFGCDRVHSEPTAEFTLKSQILDLVNELRGLEDGSVVSIEVRGGLPFRMIVEETFSG